MKIAFLAPELLPNWSGVGTYCIELVKSLSAYDDVELHVITLTRNIRGFDTYYTESDILDFFNGRIFLHILTNTKETFRYNIRFQFNIFKYLPKIIKSHKIELIHSQYAHMPDLLLKFRDVPIATVTTVHSTVKTQYEGIKATNQKWSEMDSSERYQVILYPILRTAERFYLKKCKNFIFVSHWTERHVRKNFPFINAKSAVIHNGVNSDLYAPNKYSCSEILRDVQDPIVLYASRFTAARGAHVLANAIPIVLKDMKDVHFVFAGASNKKPLLDILKAKDVPKEKYTILGYVDYKDLPALYAKAFIYVMPTSWENLPFKLLEAMSSENAVITTRVGGIPEVVKDGYNGIFVQRKPGDIAEAIKKLLNNRYFAKKLGKNARKTILESFRWENVAEKTKKVYESILNSSTY